MLVSQMIWQVLLLLLPLILCDYNSSDICGWSQPRAAQIRDYIWVEGGSLLIPNDGSCVGAGLANSSIGWLFNLSLHDPFDISNENSPASFKSVTEGADLNPYLSGYMFADYDELYAWGGSPFMKANRVFVFTLSLPLYDRTNGAAYTLGAPATNWAPESENFLPRTNGVGANAPSESLGFYFGGMYNSDGSSFTTSSHPKNRSTDLIKVDMTNQRQAEFAIFPLNESVTPWRAEAGMVWIPTSTQGILVVIGGMTAAVDIGLTPNDTHKTASLNFLKEFPVYDIGSNIWTMQTMDPSSPFPDKPLVQFCTVVASAADGSHHDIFVYGGGHGDYSSPTADVWVLSVPSFTWIKVDSGNRPIPRVGHSCISPYPDQMIVIGGTDVGQSELAVASESVDVFNLNILNWTGSYDPDIHDDYKPHQTILDVISKKPKAENMSAQVGAWFDQKYNMDKIKFYGPYARQVPPQPTPPNNDTDSGNSTGSGSGVTENNNGSSKDWVVPVAVAVPIGSVAILVILGLLLFRRKRHLERLERERETTEVDQRKSWVIPGIWAITPQHREVGADTKTEEVEQQLPKSPPQSPEPQELPAYQREGYFTPSDTGVSGNQRWSSTTPARSPLAEYTGPVEGPDNAIHEVEDQRHHQHSVSEEINYDPRNLGAHPPSIVSARHRGYSGDALPGSPDTYHLPGPLDAQSATATHSTRGFAVLPEGEYASDYASQPGFGPLDQAVSPMVGRQNQRPRHGRHNSSVSSGMSLPSPDLQQSPRSMPRVSRSLSGEHDQGSPDINYQEGSQGNQTY